MPQLNFGPIAVQNTTLLIAACVLLAACAPDAAEGDVLEPAAKSTVGSISDPAIAERPDASPQIVYTHFTGGTPQELSAFQIGPAVLGVTTLNWRSSNPDLNGKPKTHRLRSSLPVNDDLTIESFLMKNFYGYDAQANLIERLAAIRSKCEGEQLENGLIKFTADALSESVDTCKKVFDITGRRPVYISQQETAQPFFIECRSNCNMKIIKWRRIGFDVPIPETQINQWNDVLSASFEHIDNMLTPVGQN